MKEFNKDDELYLQAVEEYERQQEEKRNKAIRAIYSRLSGDEVPPTDKQINYAKTIAQELNKELPEKQTKTTISDFISSNVNDYKDSVNFARDNI